jgi:hypothetical protein
MSNDLLHSDDVRVKMAFYTWGWAHRVYLLGIDHRTNGVPLLGKT